MFQLRQTAKNTNLVYLSGDSYSQTGFDVTSTKPNAANPLGNPALPGWTASGGLNVRSSPLPPPKHSRPPNNLPVGRFPSQPIQQIHPPNLQLRLRRRNHRRRPGNPLRHHRLIFCRPGRAVHLQHRLAPLLRPLDGRQHPRRRLDRRQRRRKLVLECQRDCVAG